MQSIICMCVYIYIYIYIYYRECDSFGRNVSEVCMYFCAYIHLAFMHIVFST